MSTVLHPCIEDNSDPIFKEGEDLQAGDRARLFTRTGKECLGVGVVQEYDGQAWGGTGFLLVPAMTTRARVRKWVVWVDEVLMPGAHIMYSNSDKVGTSNARGHMEIKEGGLVMWDASRMRKHPTSPAALALEAVEYGTVQKVADAAGTPRGGTEQDEGEGKLRRQFVRGRLHNV